MITVTGEIRMALFLMSNKVNLSSWLRCLPPILTLLPQSSIQMVWSARSRLRLTTVSVMYHKEFMHLPMSLTDWSLMKSLSKKLWLCSDNKMSEWLQLQLATMMTLAQPEVHRFKGDRIKYGTFIIAFKALIESRTSNAAILLGTTSRRETVRTYWRMSTHGPFRRI